MTIMQQSPEYITARRDNYTTTRACVLKAGTVLLGLGENKGSAACIAIKYQFDLAEEQYATALQNKDVSLLELSVINMLGAWGLIVDQAQKRAAQH
jgi:hypothetical protein